MRRARLRLVAFVVAIATVCGGCTDDPSTSQSNLGVRVGEDGARASLDGLTVSLPAGAAPVGQHLHVQRSSTPPPAAGQILRTAGPLVDVSLDDGAQPSAPVTLTLQAPSSRPGMHLLSRHGQSPWQLTAATWDVTTKSYTATVDRFSVFGFVDVDVSAAVTQVRDVFTSTFELAAPKPACSGKPLSVDGVTYRLPEVYRSKGDGLVWPCLAPHASGVDVTLTNAGGLPLLVRSRPKAAVTRTGTVDIEQATLLAIYDEFLTGGPYSQSLLLPGKTSTYRFSAQAMPARIDLRIDGFAQEVSALIWVIRSILEVLVESKTRVAKALKAADILTCVSDAVDAGTRNRFDGASVGAVAKATISCAGPVIEEMGGTLSDMAKVVLAALARGVSLAASGLVATWRSASSTDVARIDITASVPAPTLGFDHYGPVRLGMTPTKAAQLLGTRVADIGESGSDQCWQPNFAPPFDGVTLMTSAPNGPIERFSIYGSSMGTSPTRKPRTDAGIQVGSTESQVRRAYRVTVEDHAYDIGGHYLTANGPTVNGQPTILVFETDGERVTTIRGGYRDSAQAIEGCS